MKPRRIERGRRDTVRMINVYIFFVGGGSVLVIAIAAIFGWAFLLLLIGTIFFGTMIATEQNVNWNTEREYWKTGYKRKFKIYEGAENEVYVETLYCGWWIPLYIEVRSTYIKYDTDTGEPIEKLRGEIKQLTFSSIVEAQEEIHKMRGSAAATIAGEFEA